MIKIPEAMAGDIMVMDSEDYGLSKECESFVTKLHASTINKYRNNCWYEINATAKEVNAVIDEVLVYVIDKINDDLDLFTDAKERAQMRRYRARVQQWINENTKEEK